MTTDLLEFVGRDRECAQLRGALGRAAQSRGSVWMLCGEPGIGKSRLLQELDRYATGEGFCVVWGRAWEAGGAPAYWPWVQLLRSLLRARPDLAESLDPRDAAPLAQLVPELDTGEQPPVTLEPERARFRLLEAVSEFLLDASSDQPLLLLLEDLHMADASSLVMLEFLAGRVSTAGIMIAGTLREADAGLRTDHQVLDRLLASAQTLSLRPLDEAQVGQFVRAVLGSDADSRGHEIHRVTEGNPLFVTETLRLLAARGSDVAATSLPLPGSVTRVIAERLDRLHPPTRSLLGAAAVVGREFDATTLARLVDEDRKDIDPALDQAASAWVVTALDAERHRFGHILLREVLYRQLDPGRRRTLHAALADLLEAAPGEPRWSEIAHHRFASGLDLTAARRAAVRAAQQSAEQFAFDEAVRWWERAVSSLGDATSSSDEETFELLLGLAHAQLLAGRSRDGTATCARASDLARAMKSPERLARAALERGSVFYFAAVDSELVARLTEAVEALPRGDSPLRARLLARLASAMQPASDPTAPMAMAREAIAMARRTGDDETLLDALRSGCSALMDLAPASERLALNREHIELGTKLARLVDVWRGRMRTVFDLVDFGDIAGAYAAIEAADAVSSTLDHPAYRWPVVALRALQAQREGRFDAAEAFELEARSLGERAGDDNAPRCLNLQRIIRATIRGDLPTRLEALGDVYRTFGGSPQEERYGRLVMAGLLARGGRPQEAFAHLAQEDLEHALQFGDAWLLSYMCQLALAARSRDLTQRLYETLLPRDGAVISGGMIGISAEEPVSLLLGRLSLALGRDDQARTHLLAALAHTEATRARPFEARVLVELAELETRVENRARGEQLRHRALQIARELGMPDLLARLGDTEPSGESPRPDAEPLPKPTPSRAAERAFTMRRDGDMWRLTWHGRTFALKPVKGLSILARLVEEPGRAFHVLDLLHPGRDVGAQGDTGPVLDDEAKRAYAERLEDLREAEREAEQFGDETRASAARAEIEALASELARAVGLGGRDRKAGSTTERARINVQRRLKDAIRRIGEHEPALAKRLSKDVRTGAFCSYDPA